ncbi:MAG: ATP-dependent DNA helicase [Magnetococcus sp. DMHC-6]
MENLNDFIHRLFGPESRLAQNLPYYEPRHVQNRMAFLVTQAASQGCHLLVEAGTGTGKTLAYLLPLLSFCQQLTVSTATKALQDQITETDLPLLRRVLNRPLVAVTLKGRNNYLCLYRLRAFQVAPLLADKEEENWFQEVLSWSRKTQTGDRDELSNLPEQLNFWRDLNAGGERCLGRKCPDYDACFLFAMREKAKHANLVIVNHHLFFADLAVKEGGFGEILPKHQIVVFDEAHQIPDVVTAHFGLEISTYQLRELAQDGRAEFQTVGADDIALMGAFSALESAATGLRQAFPGENVSQSLQAEDLRALPGRALTEVIKALKRLIHQLDPHRTRSSGLAALGRRAEVMLVDTEQIQALNDPARVYWYETRNRNIFLKASPLDTGPTLREALYPRLSTAIFTSATLATSKGYDAFDFFERQMGVPPNTAYRDRLDSPFDFTQRALLYVPRSFPDPREPSFETLLVQEIVQLLHASSGRALCLFTSLQKMEMVYQAIRDELPFPLLVQGERPKKALLEIFRRETASVLMAVRSFWEGVDIPGESLSLVIIDRIPFDVPDEPLTKARSQHIVSLGGNDFMDFSLPKAILSLKQGVGRLLRRSEDRGVLAILDIRLFTKRYGSRILAELPPAPLTRECEVVKRFFQA